MYKLCINNVYVVKKYLYIVDISNIESIIESIDEE